MKREDQHKALLGAFPKAFSAKGGVTYNYWDGKRWQKCKDNDPLEDLNAARVCEAELSEEQGVRFMHELAQVVGATYETSAGYSDWKAVIELKQWSKMQRATAEQRFEALLRTIGKWNNQTKGEG